LTYPPCVPNFDERKNSRPQVGNEGSDMPLCSIEEAIADIRQGKMIILVDDEGRENEGDLTMGRRTRDPGSHQLHGQIWQRPHLPAHGS